MREHSVRLAKSSLTVSYFKRYLQIRDDLSLLVADGAGGRVIACVKADEAGLLMSMKCDLVICQIVDPQVTVRAELEEEFFK